MRSLNERLKNAFSKRNISLYNNQLQPNKKYRVYRNQISTNTISIKKRNYYSQKLKIPNSGKVAPCTAKQIPKQAALTIQRITSVHFKPEFIGCHLNIWLKMAHTRLTKGIPTSKIPAMYITMADSGEVGSTTSAIGKREMRAAPPPTATAIAANNSATNTTPNTNSIGLQ